MYKYLYSTLQVYDPLAHVAWERQELAWTLVRMLLSRGGDSRGSSGCRCFHRGADRYSDAAYYCLRNVYFTSFRTIYDAVFAWEDAPARVIVHHWRAYRERCRMQREKQEQQEQQASGTHCGSTSGSTTAAPVRTRRQRSQKASTPKPLTGSVASKSPSKSKVRDARNSAAKQARQAPSRSPSTSPKHHRPLTLRGDVVDQVADHATVRPTNQVDDTSSTSSHHVSTAGPVAVAASPSHKQVLAVRRRTSMSKSQQQKLQSDGYEHSPTKRKLSAVRYVCLRVCMHLLISRDHSPHSSTHSLAIDTQSLASAQPRRRPH